MRDGMRDKERNGREIARVTDGGDTTKWGIDDISTPIETSLSV